MYSENRRRSPLLPALLGIAAAVAAIALLQPGRGPDEMGVAAIGNAVQQSALQCYVVEGAYPPTLAYLEENYGLQVNTRSYYVVYEAFSSNLPPTIRVIPRA